MKRTTFLYTLVLAFLLGFLATAPVTAQHHRHGVQSLLKQLDLSEVQKEQLKALRTERSEATRAWMAANSGATREQKQAYREEQRDASRAALENILTTEQQQQLETLKEQHTDGRKARRGHRRAHRTHAMAHRLNLSDAQKEQLKQLRTGQREATHAWMKANNDVSPEQKQAFMEEQREKAMDALNSVLTPGQRQQFEALKAQRLEGRWGPRGHRRAHRLHRLQHLSEKLDLTEAQQSEIKTLNEARREAARGWHEANPNATHEELKAYRSQQAGAHRTALKAVLTVEQRQTLEAMQAERGERRGQRGERPEQDYDDGAPKESAFELRNYPNPFNPTTEIQFTVAQESHVSLIVYDVQGREVRTLLDAPLQAGPHTANFDASGLPTGTYLYRLTVGNETETGRMVLVK